MCLRCLGTRRHEWEAAAGRRRCAAAPGAMGLGQGRAAPPVPAGEDTRLRAPKRQGGREGDRGAQGSACGGRRQPRWRKPRWIARRLRRSPRCLPASRPVLASPSLLQGPLLHEQFYVAAAAQPQAVCLVDDASGTALTYGQVAEGATTLARTLARLGVGLDMGESPPAGPGGCLQPLAWRVNR